MNKKWKRKPDPASVLPERMSGVLIAAILFSIAATYPAAQETAEGSAGATFRKLWETGRELSTPESVLYDQSRSRIYVSNVGGQPTEKDGNGFISILSPDGAIVTRTWVQGLDAPKGMALSGNSLYVSDIDRLVEIDVETGEIRNAYPGEGALFLNDVAVDGEGTVYVTEYAEEHSGIYRLQDGNLSLWKQDAMLAMPNGLLAEEDRLIAGVAGGRLLSVPYAEGEITVLADLSGTISGIDGIVSLGEGEYLVSDWAGAILRVDTATLAAEGPDVLSNTSADAIRAADIGFAGDRRMVLVPTFDDNRVMAYSLDD